MTSPQTPINPADKLDIINQMQAMANRSDFVEMVKAQITEQVQRIIEESSGTLVVSDFNVRELITTVVAGLNMAVEGDPQGMVRLDDETGTTATRVIESGIPLWRLSTGGTDSSPTLNWRVIYDPTA